MIINKTIENILRSVKWIGLRTFTISMIIIMFQAKMNYSVLILFNEFGEAKLEYILAILFIISYFLVYIIDKYKIE